MSELSQLTKQLIQNYRAWYQSKELKPGTSTIHVDEVASRVAGFYEKIRGVVDWREEHLMRRAAISRALKRRLLLLQNDESIAEPLILELIRGGHFPNDRIEESKIGEVQKAIDKYLYISQNNPVPTLEKDKLQLYNWTFDMAACEIEDIISPYRREKALIEYMMEIMKGKIKLQEGILSIGGTTLSDEERNNQIYIAIHRALFKLDSSIIIYHLLKRRYPQWSNLPPDQLKDITNNIYSIWKGLEGELNHPLSDKFYKICEKYDTPYLLLGDVLSEEGPDQLEQKFSNPEVLEELIKRSYHKRLLTLKTRLFRAAFYSTLSIFLTNSFSLLVLEIPLAKLITGSFSPITILVDILGPTFLMLLLTATVQTPSRNNLEVVVMETMKIVYRTESIDRYEVKIPKKKGIVTKTLIGFIYLLGAIVSFGLIVWIFQVVNFPPTSVVINIMFVALIAFAGLAVRERSKELTIEERKESFLGFFFDIFFLPVAGLGRFLSAKWKKYNAVAIFFSTLIDVPFQVFVEFLEQWRTFLKEKKEEIH